MLFVCSLQSCGEPLFMEYTIEWIGEVFLGVSSDAGRHIGFSLMKGHPVPVKFKEGDRVRIADAPKIPYERYKPDVQTENRSGTKRVGGGWKRNPHQRTPALSPVNRTSAKPTAKHQFHKCRRFLKLTTTFRHSHDAVPRLALL
jgi:hypothetical protein